MPKCDWTRMKMNMFATPSTSKVPSILYNELNTDLANTKDMTLWLEDRRLKMCRFATRPILLLHWLPNKLTWQIPETWPFSWTRPTNENVQVCNTVYEEVCEAAQPTYAGGRGGGAGGAGGASGGYGAAKAPACRRVPSLPSFHNISCLRAVLSWPILVQISRCFKKCSPHSHKQDTNPLLKTSLLSQVPRQECKNVPKQVDTWFEIFVSQAGRYLHHSCVKYLHLKQVDTCSCYI